MANSKSSGGLNAFGNKHIMPVAAKIGSFKPLIAVRDGIAMAMPLIVVGSLFMIINSFPVADWSDWLSKTAVHGISLAQILAKITNGSFGIMGLIAAFGIAWSYANQYKTDGVSAGIVSASVFFILTPSIMSGDKVPVEGFPYTYLGSRGLFVAIIFGLLSAWIFQWFITTIFKLKCQLLYHLLWLRVFQLMIAPMVNAITTYCAMNLGLVPLCNGTVIPWTMPPIISGFLATGSIAGSMLQVINIILDILIYLPFIVALNKRQLIEEDKAE